MFSPNYECVCLLGDFNSRTATDDDFIFIDDDDPSTEGIDIVNSVPFVFKRSALTLNQNTNLHSVSTGEILSESCSLKPKAIPPPNYECVCLLGDLNSRTATDDDFIFIDDDDPSTGHGL
jgi:hypothetical protein